MEAESATVGSIPIHVQLEQLAKNLSTAARTLALQAEKQKLSLASKNAGDQLGNDVNNVDLLNARRDVLSQARGICTLLSTPADFLERLAMNVCALSKRSSSERNRSCANVLDRLSFWHVSSGCAKVKSSQRFPARHVYRLATSLPLPASPKHIYAAWLER